jgi:hypothetical protein
MDRTAELRLLQASSQRKALPPAASARTSELPQQPSAIFNAHYSLISQAAKSLFAASITLNKFVLDSRPKYLCRSVSAWVEGSSSHVQDDIEGEYLSRFSTCAKSMEALRRDLASVDEDLDGHFRDYFRSVVDVLATKLKLADKQMDQLRAFREHVGFVTSASMDLSCLAVHIIYRVNSWFTAQKGLRLSFCFIPRRNPMNPAMILLHCIRSLAQVQKAP